MLIGHIKEIVRHPVKSFYGESVQKTRVMDYGLYGDRSHTFLDKTRPGKFLTITQFPEMVRYKARFVGEELMEEYPKIEIMTPEGKILDWGNEELTKEIENKSKRKISLITYSPSNVPLGAIEEEHIQLVTDASLQELKQILGKTEIDYRRFRPNLLISLKDKIPFIEEKWFGRRIRIGNEVELELKRHCERCMIITVNPDSAERDSTLLKTVAKERNNYFGVYATVIRTGEINVGDEVLLE
ncbi:MOSC domain-containing protein [Bacillus sp. CMF12]|uniref:MOSC domain-containing protein n=1 Tax=Bacillaceae TaxID=186817 RepID=UPI001FB2E9D2|nr:MULTISPECIES: MOSC domain-containing protein [Bacillaceae]UOE56104.1 MOSC domain-containing protein [Cytobacillus oceanisediminis]USK50584.1 MOSC domain-containing protein [Bacillus sp. CMF12]